MFSYKNYSKKGFTLIEMVLVTIILSLVFLVIISTYLGMISSRVQIQARQTLTENTYFMLERLNAVVSDFTIDYE
ncbi:PulJ/GspJ family protein, partial [Candidatus Vampirococcus lugosii]